MSITTQPAPTSRVRFGTARADTTPPVGIYHPMWGAARHFRATANHRQLFTDVVAIAPTGQERPALVRVLVDLVGLGQEAHDALRSAAQEAAGVAAEQVLVGYSHTHAAGLFTPDRVSLPGGEMIADYLQKLTESVRTATREAVAAMQDAVITYGAGCCDLAVNRDYWDDANDLYACGFNPGAPADDTVTVARVTDADGGLICTLVNYACHPTTLAWENTQNSPDYPGALRSTVEAATGAPCVFALGACGELGPRQGYVGDTAVADQNGRQLAYAALSAIEAMDPPQMDFAYAGPVVSGATLGTWTHEEQDADRVAQSEAFSGGCYTVVLPLKDLPQPDALRAEMAELQKRQQEADEAGDAIAARDCGARFERARRWLGRIAALPDGGTMPVPYSVHRMGDAVWITVAGEPYSQLQTELRARFPDQTLLISPMTGAMVVAYLLPRDLYGQGLYQEEPSPLAPGCLEMLIDTVAEKIESLSQ